MQQIVRLTVSLQGFPMLFYAIEGKDEREANSPSFFNVLEAAKVCNLIKEVLGYQKSRTTPDEIGLIAPYRVAAITAINSD